MKIAERNNQYCFGVYSHGFVPEARDFVAINFLNYKIMQINYCLHSVTFKAYYTITYLSAKVGYSNARNRSVSSTLEFLRRIYIFQGFPS